MDERATPPDRAPWARRGDAERQSLRNRRGPRAVLAFLIGALYSVLFAALLLRVIGSWFGLFRYSRWMRPAYALTDWLVEPIRRLLPPMGALDWSPLVAWLVLWLLKQLLLNVVLL